MATGYIISPWDFSVVQSVNVTDYDLPLECYPGETGSVTFEGKAGKDYSQYIFRLGVLDTMWKIKEAETGDATSTKLSVTDATGILDGAIMQSGFDESWYKTKLDGNLLDQIVTGPIYGNYDVQYERFIFPYIRGRTPNWNPYDPNHVISPGGFAAFDAYIQSLDLTTADYAYYTGYVSGGRRFSTDLYKLVTDLVASSGVKVSYSVESRFWGLVPSDNSLALYVNFSLYPNRSAVIPVYFNDGHSSLLSESYDSDVCSCYIGLSGSTSLWPTNYVYYLDENMQIVQNKSEQINGFTKIETVSSNAEALTNAAATFGANQWKHKVEFASDKVLHLGQPVKLILERGILNTAIGKVSIKSGDDRYFYTCGDLPQTAAQHIKANSWSYGARLPHRPYAGQLAFI